MAKETKTKKVAKKGTTRKKRSSKESAAAKKVKSSIAKSRTVKQDVKKTGKEEKKIVYARARYLKGSAQKARLVADLVRGMNAQEAVERLHFVQKRASRLIRKAIESAMASASNNFEMDKKSLVIKEIYVDEAPTFRRGRAGSRGRYQKLLKRNCHITVGLLES